MSLDQLTAAFDGALLDELEQKVRTRFRSGGRFLSVDGEVATFGVKNAHYQPRVEDVKPEVERAIQAMFGAVVRIEVVVDGDPTPPPGSRNTSQDTPSAPVDPDAEIADVGDIAELADASDIAASGVERITQAFPGATVVPPPNS